MDLYVQHGWTAPGPEIPQGWQALRGRPEKEVFSYEPKTQKLSDYALYFQNENFHGPNDLIFDRQGGLYFTDPWGTSMANLRGVVYYALLTRF